MTIKHSDCGGGGADTIGCQGINKSQSKRAECNYVSDVRRYQQQQIDEERLMESGAKQQVSRRRRGHQTRAERGRLGLMMFR